MRFNSYWMSEAKKAFKLAWKNRDQRTWCFCPICQQDLCSTDSFVSDTGEGHKNEVKYKCSRCGCKSTWNFDIIPGGFLMRHQKLEEEETKYDYE